MLVSGRQAKCLFMKDTEIFVIRKLKKTLIYGDISIFCDKLKKCVHFISRIRLIRIYRVTFDIYCLSYKFLCLPMHWCYVACYILEKKKIFISSIFQIANFSCDIVIKSIFFKIKKLFFDSNLYYHYAYRTDLYTISNFLRV